MRISLDLDDTLILCDRDLPRDPQRVPFFLRWWLSERVRAGTSELMRGLNRRGVELLIYTTSERSPRYIRYLLRCYGARVAHAINGEIHRAVISLQLFAERPPSKFPPAFEIDLHVDDSPGVAEEGERHDFDVLVIAPDDADWVAKVLEAVDARS